MLLVILAHPYLDHSRANRALAAAIRGLDDVEVRSLYDRYPDFTIDVAAEQRALERASVVVWQHPIYWYSVPALLKLWFEKVLTPGWAYGPAGTALHGKRCLWVATAGGDEVSYAPDGLHRHSLNTFEPAVRQTAQFCGMTWLAPFLVIGAHRIDDDELTLHARRYRARLAELVIEEQLARA